MLQIKTTSEIVHVPFILYMKLVIIICLIPVVHQVYVVTKIREAHLSISSTSDMLNEI